jgi:hypothetical protein
MGDCFKPTGNTKQESRIIEPFDHLEIRDRINVYISYGTTSSAIIEGGKNLLDMIKTEVKNGVLLIENENRCNWVRSFKKDINVYLTTPEFHKMTYRGSGEVVFQDTLRPSFFQLNCWDASGSIHFLFNSPKIELKAHTGPTEIFCAGKVDYLINYLNSSGLMNTANCEANRVLAINNNTGLLTVKAKNKLKAEISGSGNIAYYGDPEIELIDNGKGNLVRP